MARVQIPFKGITTTSTYEDGDCYSLVNLRPKNGALQPVAPRKVVHELSQDYDIIFVHQNNNEYENWIGVVNGETSAIIYKDVDTTPQPITKNGEPVVFAEPINAIQQIGNTLSLATSGNIYYLLFKDGQYKYLGELPEFPAFRVFSEFSSEFKRKFYTDYGEKGVTPEKFIEYTKALVYKTMDVAMNGGEGNEGDLSAGVGGLLWDAHFIRCALRLFDGTLIKHTPPVLVMPDEHILEMKKISYDFNSALIPDSLVTVKGYRVNMNIRGFNDIADWIDIIKSTDVFISQPLGLSNIEEMRQDMPTSDSPHLLTYPLIKGLSPNGMDNVKDNSTFYLIRSISTEFPSGQASFIFPAEQDERDKMLINNIVQQEAMSNDDFTHHKYGSENTYVYNNRLHLGGIKTTFFKGFSYEYFALFLQRYNGVDPTEISGNFIIETEINVGPSIQKVYSEVSNKTLFTSPFLSYPDPRARKMTIYRIDNAYKWTYIMSVILKPHRYLNIAFYVDDKLKPMGTDQQKEFNALDISQPISLVESNKLKVSELNNPFFFPNENTYMTGNGTIMAIATNTMNVSDWNYGQFPLYVFTNQGIWTLNVGGGETVYSNQSAPTTVHTPTSEVTCSTPHGVVFVTARGVHIINGNAVEYLSPQLETPYARLVPETNERTCQLLHPFPEEDFIEYIKGISHIIYNPAEDEIVVSNISYSYNYVLNLPTGTFYQSTERIDTVVQNIFPKLFVVGNREMKDFSESGAANTHVSLMLRPLGSGMPGLKQMEKLVLNSTLYHIRNVFFGTYRSMDQVNFRGVCGQWYTNIPRAINYSTGMMARVTGTHFLFACGAIVDNESRLNYLDVEFDIKY